PANRTRTSAQPRRSLGTGLLIRFSFPLLTLWATTPHYPSNRVLAKSSRDGVEQQRLLLREHRAQIEDEAVVFDARNHRDAGRGAAEALFPLGRRGPSAREGAGVRREALRGR